MLKTILRKAWTRARRNPALLVLVSISAFAQIPAGNVCNGGYFSGTQQCTSPEGRIYRVVVPPNLPAGSPIFVALHGTQAASVYAANGMMSTTGWDLAWATKSGVLAIFPEASIDANGKKNWVIDFATGPPRVDDVAFIRSLVVKYSRIYSTDPKKNHVAGFSMGADMAFKVAREASDLFAAFASVEGHEWTLPTGMIPSFPVIKPVSAIMFCGGKDYILPCPGGDPNPNVHVPSVDDDFAFWVHVAGLQDDTAVNPILVAPGKMLSHKLNTGALLPPVILPVPYSQSVSGFWKWDATSNKWNASAATSITVDPPPPPNLNTKTSVAVEFYGLPNGGHNWYRTSMTDPTQVSYQPDVAASLPAGTTTSDLVLRFFLAHPKP